MKKSKFIECVSSRKSVFVAIIFILLSCNNNHCNDAITQVKFRINHFRCDIDGDVKKALLYGDYLICLTSSNLYVLDSSYDHIIFQKQALTKLNHINDIFVYHDDLILQTFDDHFIVLDSTLNRELWKESVWNAQKINYALNVDTNFFVIKDRGKLFRLVSEYKFREISDDSFMKSNHFVSKSLYYCVWDDSEYSVDRQYIGTTTFFQKHTGKYFMLPLVCSQLFRINKEFYFIESYNGGCFNDHSEFLKFSDPSLFFPVKPFDSSVNPDCDKVLKKWWNMELKQRTSWKEAKRISTYFDSLQTFPLISFVINSQLYSVIQLDSTAYIIKHGEKVKFIDSTKIAFCYDENRMMFSNYKEKNLSWRLIPDQQHSHNGIQLIIVNKNKIDIVQSNSKSINAIKMSKKRRARMPVGSL